MRKLVVGLLAAALMMAAMTLPVSAHITGPCNDSDGDGSFSGAEYAEHHISALAKVGGLGNGAHKPGSHKGFSICNPSGK